MSGQRRRMFGLAIAATALLAVACVPVNPGPPLPAPPPVVSPPANSPTTTIDGNYIPSLSQPWDIAFEPGGALLFTEKHGTVSMFVAPGPRKVLGTVSGSVVHGEGGLMGIAVDPDFATNGFAYVCTTTATDNRIVRLTLDLTQPANLGITAQTPMVTGHQREGVHNGCRVRFQPGSSPPALFWTMGDAAQGFQPQNLQSGNGKVFFARVDTGVAQPYPGNAFGSFVFSYGHRNPQGLAFNPNLGYAPYTTEHGPDLNDEVNRIVVGGNSGWDPVPGYNQKVPMTDLGKYPGAMVPVWRSGDQRTIAPSGATFIENVGGADWKDWNGALIMAVLKDSELRVLLMNPDGTVSGQFQAPGIFGTRLRSVVQSPFDGKLYVATDVGGGTGAIWQITPS